MKKLNMFVLSLEKGLLVLLIPCMLFLGLLQIISRFVIQRPITWSEAMLTYMFVWTSFIGASLAVHEKAHFGVELLVNKLPAALSRKLEILVSLLIFAFAGLIFYKGVYLVFANRDQLMPALPYAMSWPYLILPISSVFIAVHALYDFYTLVLGRE